MASQTDRPERMATQAPPASFAVPARLRPTTFYRYVDEKSWNQFHSHTGFTATPFSMSSEWVDRLNADAVRRHLDWDNQRPTGLIGMTSSKQIAESVARSRVREGRKDVRVYEIDAQAMRWTTIEVPELEVSVDGLKHKDFPKVFFFSMEEAERKLGVQSPSCVYWNWVALEWIPPSLVSTPRQILSGDLAGWASF